MSIYKIMAKLSKPPTRLGQPPAGCRDALQDVRPAMAGPCVPRWLGDSAPCGPVDVSVDDAWAAGNQRTGSGWSSRRPAPAAELEFEAAPAMIRKESGRDRDG